jgi:hypothetical protein
MRFCVTRWKAKCIELPSLSNGAQRGENKCKNSSFNYKSAALNQLSYAGVPHTKAVFSELIKSSKSNGAIVFDGDARDEGMTPGRGGSARAKRGAPCE